MPATLIARVVLLLVAVPLLVVTPAPLASACSCVAGVTASEHLQGADAVFAGVVRQRHDSGRSRTYVIHVQRVFKGSVRPVQEVRTSGDGASCGLELPTGDAALLFARESEGRLRVSLCDGTRTGSRLPAALGPGRPVAPAEEQPPSTGASAGVPDRLPRGVLLAGLGVLPVLLVVRARGRRRS